MKSQKEIMKEVKSDLEKIEGWNELKKFIKKNHELDEEKLKKFLIERMGSGSGEKAFKIIKENKELIERHFTGRARATTADEWKFNYLPIKSFINVAF